MKDFLVDVPVLIFFFSRPEQTKEVFKAVKESRPSQLFLIQDGPRESNKDDIANIIACREIFENIDWDCQVFKNYSDKNLGLGFRMKTGMEWVFDHVDRIIRIEDDAVPSVSWIQFCAELLEKYKDDTRIASIAGVNHLGIYDNGGFDYFFSSGGSVAAFATWKRAWKNYDYDISFTNSSYYTNLLLKNYGHSYIRRREKKRIASEKYLKDNNLKRNSWSIPMGFMYRLQNQLQIVPKVNMITNIGTVEGGTNSDGTLLAIPKKTQKIFLAKRYELKFPLHHPQYVINDSVFQDKVRTILYGGNSPIKRFLYFSEKAIRVFLVRYLKIR